MRLELPAVVAAWFVIVFSAGCGSNAGTTSSTSSSGGTATGGAGGTTSNTGGAGGVGGVGSTTTTKPSTSATAGSGGPCAHDVCQAGAALTQACSACASKVCAGDAFCCGGTGGTWDANCVSEAAALCTPGCPVNCSADTCPFGCCDVSGACHEDGCEHYGVACGGDPLTGGKTCEQCNGTNCRTCDSTGCRACVPNCQGKACGAPDGCGSRCDGACGAGEFCSISLGQCTNVCDTNSCRDGCCDLNHKCQPGVTDGSCGYLGGACAACPAGGPKCVTVPTAPTGPFQSPSSPQGGKCQACDSTTCPDGCCSVDGHCIATEKDAACGRHGAACAVCALQGSVCNGYTCAECVPHCQGKACGDSDGCGAVCKGPCPSGSFCLLNSPTAPNGCSACNATTCPGGCCSASGKCEGGADRKACGSGGQACADCGGQACNVMFVGTSDVRSCGACGQRCSQVPPGTCADDGCGSICPGAGCAPPSQGTCQIGNQGYAQCQQSGFCDPFQCNGCCDYSMGGFGGTCVPGNLPTKCGSHATQCVNCVSMSETCDVSTDKCAGCTPTQCTGKTYATCGIADGCGGRCNGAEGGTCAPGAACDASGKCNCTNPAQAICTVGSSASCIDVSSDSMNCGACGVKCPAGVACSGGSCQCPVPNAHACNISGTEVCTNLASDSNHCGSCFTVCPGTPCNDGVCGTCPSGTTACTGACANLMSDNANCGACGNACPSGTTCVNGKCPCAGGEFACSGMCSDLMTNPQHCGSCTKACPAGVNCQGGLCTCPGGATLCQGTCTNTAVDPQNCGMCGHACAPGHACSNSQCA